jgi:hypothetical protein
MARPRISSARVLRTGSPLSLEAIRQVAPAVFATTPHESRGPRYAYVPTSSPLEALLDNGWGVYEASQQRSRVQGKDPYTKHMLRMRKLGDFGPSATEVYEKDEGVPEVILINAHDGTAAYHMMAGFFRFVGSNGLMVGKHMGGFKVRHTVGPQTNAEVLAAGEATITQKFPIMVEQIGAMKHRMLTSAQQLKLADVALSLRYGSTVAPFQAAELLNARREQDAGDSVWHVMNRVQENIIDGGWETRSQMFGRRSAVRPVERVSAVAQINGGIWGAALALTV